MSHAARKIVPLSPPSTEEYLGPARVTRVAPHELEVEIRGGERAAAQMALAYPYAPAEGDVLLVIGKGGEHWVIGVIHGTGQAALAFQGGVTISARGGPLTLTSDQAVAIRGPGVEVEAGTLEVLAGSVVERFTSLYQRVRDAWNMRAGEARTIVDGSSHLTAKDASILTEETMSINGSEIHLG
jgi:Protein of unknown function (DUF3540)